MSRAGTSTDNAAMESINGRIEAELFMDLHVTGNEAVEKEVDDYILFFNEQRPPILWDTSHRSSINNGLLENLNRAPLVYRVGAEDPKGNHRWRRLARDSQTERKAIMGFAGGNNFQLVYEFLTVGSASKALLGVLSRVADVLHQLSP